MVTNMVILLSHYHQTNMVLVDKNIDQIKQLMHWCTTELADDIINHYQNTITYELCRYSSYVHNRHAFQLDLILQKYIDTYIAKHGNPLRMIKWYKADCTFSHIVEMSRQGNFYVEWFIAHTQFLSTKYLIPTTNNIIGPQ